VTVPVAAGTAARALRELHLQPGETLLINGASGAVGGMAVQLALIRGVSVVGTAGPANLDTVRALGATAVAYGEGLPDRVRRLGLNVDAVLDTAGKGALPDLIALRGSTHRVVTIADEQAESLGVTFSAGAGFSHDTQDIATALQALADGTLRTRIGHVLPLAQAARAHEISDSGHPGGKIILTP
jgi:NADPH:quinone reductase-like Zn-dependent oxidoreductase